MQNAEVSPGVKLSRQADRVGLLKRKRESYLVFAASAFPSLKSAKQGKTVSDISWLLLSLESTSVYLGQHCTSHKTLQWTGFDQEILYSQLTVHNNISETDFPVYSVKGFLIINSTDTWACCPADQYQLMQPSVVHSCPLRQHSTYLHRQHMRKCTVMLAVAPPATAASLCTTLAAQSQWFPSPGWNSSSGKH